MQMEWDAFIKGVLPNKTIQKSQYAIMRRCFFAGFITTFGIIANELQNCSTDEDVDEMMQDLSDDAREFLREIKLHHEMGNEN